MKASSYNCLQWRAVGTRTNPYFCLGQPPATVSLWAVCGVCMCVSVRACVYVRVREERKDGSGGELEVKDKNDVIQGRVTERKIQTKY